MNDTPRTNKSETLPYMDCGNLTWWVPRDFARALEIELAEANECAAQLQASLLTMTKAATMIVKSYEPRFFRAGKWAQSALDACRDTMVTDIAAECGQYADKHLAPAPSSAPADTPEALQNQGFNDGEPVGDRTRDLLIKS